MQRLFLFSLFLAFTTHAIAQDAGTPKPEQAAKVIDLRTMKLPTETMQPANRSLAGLFFKATCTPKAAYEFLQKQMIERGWKETNQFSSPTSASATFAKDGYHVSFFAMKGTDKKFGEHITIQMTNMGNLDSRTLPVPEKSKAIISGPMSTHYICETMTQDDGKKIMRDKLIALGWEPYGKAADAQYFKKDGIRLEMYVTKSPSQQNKTAVRYASRLMSIEVPAPVEATLVNYSDSPASLMVVVKGTVDELGTYYTKGLSKLGWKPVTEKPVQKQINLEQVFQRGKEEMTVTYQQVKTDVHVKATLTKSGE
jgi:hypothetical protein